MCNAPALAVPGTYLSLFATGTVSGSTFTADPAVSAWDLIAYSAATPPPSPSPIPSTAPTATPTPIAYYFYTGTYTVTNRAGTSDQTTTGCFVLLTTQSGAPLGTGSNANGHGVGAPNLNATDFASDIVANGSITSLIITNLSANSGSGTFSLSNGESGTIAISSRSATILDARSRLPQSVTRLPQSVRNRLPRSIRTILR